MFVKPIVTNQELNFDSMGPMSLVRCSLLMLHSRDDQIVPYRQHPGDGVVMPVRFYEFHTSVANCSPSCFVNDLHNFSISTTTLTTKANSNQTNE